MRGVMRALVVLFLVSVMPFKAWAGAGPGCPHGHAMGGDAAALGGHEPHGHPVMAVDDGDAVVPTASHAAGDHADASATSPEACGHGSPCCAPALPLTTARPVLAGGVAPHSPSPVTVAHADAALAGLERPPRPPRA
jgi:hypothetical protein